MAKFPIKFAAACLAAWTLSSGCVPPGDGVPPLEDGVRFYFPVGLRTSQSGSLLVINSDFDLQFSQGTVLSLHMGRLREVAQRPCNQDSDCEQGRICDNAPTEENSSQPSYVCVPSSDPRPCGEFGEKSMAERALAPGRCSPVDLENPQDGGERLIVDVAETSAFATEGLLLSRPCTDGNDQLRPCSPADDEGQRIQPRSGPAYPERLFIPVRGDTTIHYLDVDDDGYFSCGRPVEKQASIDYVDASDHELRCNVERSYKIQKGVTFGLDGSGNLVTTEEPPLPGDLDKDELDDINDDPLTEFRLHPEPIDLAASGFGRFIVVSHQVGGVVSTLFNSWIDRPALVHVLRDLSSNPLGVTGIPRTTDPTMPNYESESSWDFLLSYRTDARIDLLHLRDDGLLKGAVLAGANQGGEAVQVFRPQLERVDSTVIATNSPGTHSRGLVVDDRSRTLRWEACEGDVTCQAEAAQAALLVYVTNRTPSSLLLGVTGGESRLAEASLLPRIFDTVPLAAGPSRVILGDVIGPSGEREPRVFVICFDAAVIFVFDPRRGMIESEISTGRGPYSLAFDYEAGLMYVGHFTDSYVGVISIDQRYAFTYGATLATLGTPEPPRAQQ